MRCQTQGLILCGIRFVWLQSVVSRANPSSNPTTDGCMVVSGGDPLERWDTLSSSELLCGSSWEAGPQMVGQTEGRRSGHASASLGPLVYISGGWDYNGIILATVEVYDPRLGGWSFGPPMATPRLYHTMGSLDGKLYAAGGNNDVNRNLNSVEMYDPQLGSWSYVTPMGTPRYHLSVASLDGKLYAVGGFRYVPYTDGIRCSCGDCNSNYNYLDIVEVYDPTDNAGLGSWSYATPLGTRRGYLALASLNGKLYAAGGYSSDGCSFIISGIRYSGEELNSVEVYDPTANGGRGNWSYGPPMNTARQDLALASLNGKLYAVGGSDFDENSINSVEVYDPTANGGLGSWAYGPPMETARADHALAVSWFATANPTANPPTRNPTSSPTEAGATWNPTVPTKPPTTKIPTPLSGETWFPTPPTNSATSSPTLAPTEEGDTSHPSLNPTTSSPTFSPTLVELSPACTVALPGNIAATIIMLVLSYLSACT